MNNELVATDNRICVSILAPSVNEIIKSALEAEKTADVIEIRLDGISDLSAGSVAQIIKAIDTPLLFTNRAQWEGGNFIGTEEQRVDFLVQAANLGAAYVDIELKAETELRRKLLDAASQNKARVIISWHNFESTPEQEKLREILSKQAGSGADIGKIITTAHEQNDLLRVINLLDQAGKEQFPLVAFCMGKIGKITRLASIKLGGYMTYAAPDYGPLTAPGQLRASDLKTTLQILEKND
jgi:3-dehydroquinate dehydratase I